MTALRDAVRCATSAAAAAVAMRLCGRLPEPWVRPWARTNHAGDSVTLLEGPVWVLGALGGLAVPGGRNHSRAAALALTAGGLGMLDDLAGGTTGSKGLRGHLAALRRGEVTTGAVKLVGLAASGLAVAVAVDRAAASSPRRTGDRAGTRPIQRAVSTVVAAGVVAGSGNLVNLLDLRPGRALKSVILLGAPLAPDAAAAAAVGASLGVVADDLDARSMLGDTGANAAGALIGLAFIEQHGLVGRSITLAVLTALTLASERVSFSAVIDRHPVLHRLDQWGRPPTATSR